MRNFYEILHGNLHGKDSMWEMWMWLGGCKADLREMKYESVD